MIALVCGAAASGKSACAEQLALQLHETTALKTGIALRNCSLIYLATMLAVGDEAAHRIKRHRALRANKGFTTLEIPRGLAQAAPSVPGARRTTLLLEDLGNLVANEMFPEGNNATLPEDANFGKDGLGKSGLGKSVLGNSTQSNSTQSNSTQSNATLGNATQCNSTQCNSTSANVASQNTLPSANAAKDVTHAVLEGIATLETRCAQVIIVGNEVGGDEYASDEVRLYQEVLGACSCALAARAQLVIECVAGIEHILKGTRP